MALTSQQRNKLPRSAFKIAPKNAPRSQWAYPMPTAAQARKAGISEPQRQRILRNAVARAANPRTRLSYGKVAPTARKRSGRGGTAKKWAPASSAKARK